MPEINNPQLREFCNADLRQVADLLVQIDARSSDSIETYNARNLGGVIDAAGAGNLITDGSETDGRTRVVGGDVYNMVTLLQDFQTWLTQGRKDVLSKWKVNGDRP